jgi:translation initiation factor 2B subunit (eIF-2B alpha/beta/delta family)
MSEKLDQCRDRLKEEIKSVETNLAQAGQHLVSGTETKVDALEARLNESLTTWESKREHALQAGQRIRQFMEEVKEGAVSKFEDWKTDREISKLEHDADKKEEHAVDAIAVAAFAILEAEVAIMEALKARKIAIEVAG